jgi:hypothetical protein
MQFSLGGFIDTQQTNDKINAANSDAERSAAPMVSRFNRYMQDVPVGNTNSSLTALRSMAMLNKPSYVGEAGVDSSNQSQLAMDAQKRRLLEMGVNPSAGRYVGSARSAAIDAAANKAAAMTRAGRWVDQENFGRMGNLANMEQQSQNDNMRWRFQNKANQFSGLQLASNEGGRRAGMQQQATNDTMGANAYSLRTANNRSAWNNILGGAQAGKIQNTNTFKFNS